MRAGAFKSSRLPLARVPTLTFFPPTRPVPVRSGRPKAAFRSAVYKFTFKFTFKFATGSGGGHLAVGPKCRPHGVATGLTGSGSGALPARGCQGLLVLVLSCLGVAWAVGESDAHGMTRTSRTHPTTSWHWSRLGMGLLCAQKVLAESGIIAD